MRVAIGHILTGVALGILSLMAVVCLVLVVSEGTLLSYVVLFIVALGAMAVIGLTLSDSQP